MTVCPNVLAFPPDGDGRVSLWDTAGEERFRSVTQLYLRESDIGLLVFDLTSETSFDGLKAWCSRFKAEPGRGNGYHWKQA